MKIKGGAAQRKRWAAVKKAAKQVRGAVVLEPHSGQ
jgi:hypothetical protein